MQNKKFKASRIPTILWILSLLIIAFFLWIFWLAFHALAFHAHPKVLNDIIGMIVSPVIILSIVVLLNKRGRNDRILTREEKVIKKVHEEKAKHAAGPENALEVKNAWLMLSIAGIFVLLLGLGVMLMAISEKTVGMSLLGLFLLVIGLFVLIQRIASFGKTILRVDKLGITYSSTRLTKQQLYKRIPWREVNAIYLHTVSTGRSSQTYLNVEVDHPEDYYPDKMQASFKKHPGLRKFNSFGNKLVHYENVAIAIPTIMLKINSKVLEAYCQESWQDYQESHPQEMREEKAEEMAEAAAEQAENSAILENPEAYQKQKKRARFFSILIILAIILLALIGFLSHL